MGGLGSTRWGEHQRRLTAEECLILDLRILLQGSPQARHGPVQGIITWPKLDGPECPARCGFTLDITDRRASWLELQYQADREPVVCRITLIRAPAFGGRHSGFQWFGMCPGEACGRLVRKIFCRLDIPYFRCAICQDLSYRSRQTAHWDDRGDMAAAARELGILLPLWKIALRHYIGPIHPGD
jgi:hypothetical protein